MRLYPPLLFTLALFTLLISACVTPPPTQAEIVAADYGQQPDEEWAKEYSEAFILSQLKDPTSALIDWSALQKGWFSQTGKPNRFGWRLSASVNAKNSYGGYTGAKPWAFYFRGNRLVGLGEPYTSVSKYGSSTRALYVELDGADGSLDADNPKPTLAVDDLQENQ